MVISGETCRTGPAKRPASAMTVACFGWSVVCVDSSAWLRERQRVKTLGPPAHPTWGKDASRVPRHRDLGRGGRRGGQSYPGTVIAAECGRPVQVSEVPDTGTSTAPVESPRSRELFGACRYSRYSCLPISATNRKILTPPTDTGNGRARSTRHQLLPREK